MYRFFESIRCEDGRFGNVALHEQRMERALRSTGQPFGSIGLIELLKKYSVPGTGLYKCRVSYDNHSSSVAFSPYTLRQLKTLRVVDVGDLDYAHKYEDRRVLEKCLSQRGTCDDVLLMRKGMVTDTSYANLVFRKGKEWFTPTSCLLPGTMRQSLLETGVIREEEISVNEIRNFESFKLINAMVRMDAPEVGIENIMNR